MGECVAIVEVGSVGTAFVIAQVQGPAGSTSTSGYASTVRANNVANVNLAATTGRNRLLITNIPAGGMTVTMPAAPADGCTWFIKVADTSLGPTNLAHTLQVLGNGFHVEWEGSQDAGGLDAGPVFWQGNFGGVGGQAAEFSADTVGTQWISG